MKRPPAVPGAVEPLMRPVDELPDPLVIPTAPCKDGQYRAQADITPPGSKSLTNRAIFLAALGHGASTLRGALLDADDAAVMIESVQRLGAGVQRVGTTLRIEGVGGCWRVPPEGVTLALGNAGTATRFLAAGALRSPGPITLDGDARMRQRPIGELAGILAALGCGVEYQGTPGCPPVRVTPPKAAPASRGVIELGQTASSQFVSALLLTAPFIGGITLKLRGEVTSPTYIAMTLGLLAELGVEVRSSDDARVLRVGAKADLGGFAYDVEPDASGATYWWGAGAILPGASIRVLGLGERSLQGDAQFPEVLARMHCRVTRREQPASIEVTAPAALRPVLADMSEMPDAAMTLAAVACFAEGTSILRGLRTLRVKESDRIEALRSQLTRVGVRVENPVQGDRDALTITPPEGGLGAGPFPRVEFETFNDHRVAMALSLLALRRPNCAIRNPACVAKTYPTYWAEFARLLR
ncbi:MAG: 3-phosphoshikimate 1-carboxyvinyltransferase [Phycisphaerae bacterium]|nr:MAG: 3-phosphoshikimate 1-carboxyvinyltransferase [Phycisphaerae bacterium]